MALASGFRFHHSLCHKQVCHDESQVDLRVSVKLGFNQIGSISKALQACSKDDDETTASFCPDRATRQATSEVKTSFTKHDFEPYQRQTSKTFALPLSFATASAHQA